jgi:hypothetical protein
LQLSEPIRRRYLDCVLALKLRKVLLCPGAPPVDFVKCPLLLKRPIPNLPLNRELLLQLLTLIGLRRLLLRLFGLLLRRRLLLRGRYLLLLLRGCDFIEKLLLRFGCGFAEIANAALQLTPI